MSYLNTPRLTFAGKFQADPSTVNNDVTHYNNDTFQPNYQLLGTSTEPNGWWNPNGTGNYRLIGCTVTSVTYKDGTTSTTDYIVGKNIMDANSRVSGKIADLDPEQQMVSMIFGMTVRLNDGDEDLFKGDFKPASFTNLWGGNQAGAAYYQSVIKNIQWGDALHKSKYLQELNEISPDQLSIKFNVFSYDTSMFIDNTNNLNPHFTLGSLTGSIGPSFKGEPDYFVVGRQFYPELDWNPTSGYAPPNNIYFATGIVDEANKRFVIDLGNSLTSARDGSITETRQLGLAYKTGEARWVNFPLGDLPYNNNPDWYINTAGIVTIPLNDEQINIALNNTLYIVDTGNPLTDDSVLLTEKAQYIRADNFVFRLNPGWNETLTIYASRLGKPFSGAIVELSQQNSIIGGQTPATGLPATAISFNQAPPTDSNGVTFFELVPSDPGNNRGYIDGQVYALWYNFKGESIPWSNPPAKVLTINPSDFISIIVHDIFNYSEPVTWPQILPIMQQYANLYPIMSKGVFNLADRSAVDANAKLLKMVFNLPITDPNHMPVTRDLSKTKLAAINKYLDNVINNG